MFYLTEYVTLKIFNMFSYISVKNGEIGYDIPICCIFKLQGEAIRRIVGRTNWMFTGFWVIEFNVF